MASLRRSWFRAGQSNSLDTDSSLAIRRIASPIKGATVTSRTFLQALTTGDGSMVSVTTSSSSTLAEKREYPRVEQHETLRSSIDATAGCGHDQDEYENDSCGDHGYRDRPRVVPSRPPRSRVHTLTTA